ncbi:MAG: redoxin domain-containing protein [Phycisphaerae bacterium]|nr:redoxin domain-containing protein [Phycisphaerae bacterium]
MTNTTNATNTASDLKLGAKVGDRAPAVALPCKPGEVVDLANVFGKEKVVLLFIPLAFSPVCTTELCTFRDSWSQWNELGAKVYAISVDSPFVTDKFRQSEGIPFPVLSDFNKTVSASYNALHADLMGLKGVSKRSAFVVDRNGVIAYAWVSEDPRTQVDFEAVRAAVADAK